jgi:glycine betaine transporter
MSKVGNVNAVCYFFIMLFILVAGPVGLNRLLGLLLTSMGQFAVDFVPMTTFADPILETGWQDDMTMYYYSWNIAPAMIGALFYVTLGYGRTLREFVVYNCLLPACVNCVWYTVFGGTAMIAILNGADLYQTIQQFGDGISTFAFLDMLPAGAFFKWFFIILAVLTFLTFSDGVAFSFPMLFMKKTEIDASKTRVPKVLNIAVALFMGALTLVLLYAGGYEALSECMVVVAFPIAIVLLLMCLSVFKFLFHREKHDATYREELEEERARKQEEFDNRVAAAARNLLGE